MTSSLFFKNRMAVIVITLAGVFWFMLLGYRDLIDPDEGRYAEIAREMLSTGDWITPRLNGFKYFEKPPLQYWGSAISMILFGETNTAARIWCAGLGFIGALWTGYVGSKLYEKRAGFYSFLILVSSILYFAMGHINSLDMGVSVFLSIAIGSLVLAQSERTVPDRCRNWMLVAWAALAGATLSKGLIGLVLPGGAVVLYTIWQRDWALWRNLHIGKGLIVYLILTAPWFIAVSQANPEFPHFFFIHEHFERFTSDVHQRSKPAWFFFAVLAVGVLPWVGTVIGAIFKPSFSWRAESGKFEASRFLWVYALFIFFFFSISTSKLPPYILPMFFALALLAGEKAVRTSHFTMDGIVAILLAIIFVVVGWKMMAYVKPKYPVESILMFRPWVFASAFCMGFAGVSILVCKSKKWVGPGIFALSTLLAMQLIFTGFQSFSAIRSAKLMAQAIAPLSDKGVEIYSIYRYDHSLSYYLGRTVNIVGFTGELEFGIQQDPDKWLTGLQFLDLWPDYQQAIAVIPRKFFENWQKKEGEMRLIYQDSRRVVVARR